MSKKKKKTGTGTTRYEIGARVRVKPGIADPDYPDIPMGGWVGTITEIDDENALYLIKWSRETLAGVTPVFRKRCKRDGLDYEESWLEENDIALYDGRPLKIEQPANVTSRTLSEDDQDDRIRIILGLTGDDPLPDVDGETLCDYHKYLAAELTFPFKAKWEQERGPLTGTAREIIVTGLLPPDDCDEFYGLFCKARRSLRKHELPLGEVEAKERGRNHQLLDDYSYWFWNWR